MAQLIFPPNPTDGQEYAGGNGITYVYKSTPGVWTSPVSNFSPVNPTPSDFTASPPFDGGNGTFGNPYIISPIEVFPGSSGSSKQTLTVRNQAPGKYVITSDLNQATNGVRFAQPAHVIEPTGTASFPFYFNDYPTTSSGGTYTGLLKVGSVYFRWVVTVESTDYNDLPTTGPGTGFYNVNPSNSGGTVTLDATLAAFANPQSWSTYGWGTNTVLNPPGGLSRSANNYFAIGTDRNVWRATTGDASPTNAWESLASTNPAYQDVVNSSVFGGRGQHADGFQTYVGGAAHGLLIKSDGTANLCTVGAYLAFGPVISSVPVPGPIRAPHPYTIPIGISVSGGVMVVIGGGGDVYATQYVPTGGGGGTSPYTFGFSKPALGSSNGDPGSVGTWGRYMTSPIGSNETIINAWPLNYGSGRWDLIVLTDAGNVYTTFETTDNQAPALYATDVAGLCTNLYFTFGAAGITSGSVGLLKRNGEIWGQTFSNGTASNKAGAFGTQFPLQRLYVPETCVSPPQISGPSWYALTSSGYIVGGQSSPVGVYVQSQPSPIFNTRQKLNPLTF
jgi:hypothetical protein